MGKKTSKHILFPLFSTNLLSFSIQLQSYDFFNHYSMQNSKMSHAQSNFFRARHQNAEIWALMLNC